MLGQIYIEQLASSQIIIYKPCVSRAGTHTYGNNIHNRRMDWATTYHSMILFYSINTSSNSSKGN